MASSLALSFLSLMTMLTVAGCGTSPNNTAAMPAFTPAAGTYSSSQTVTVSDVTPGAVLYCTTNGTAPTTSSPVCPEPLTVATTETLSAIAAEPGGSPSAVATAAYVINLPAAATPAISPVAGTYTASQSVSITDATAGATIYYTTDGTAPTVSSTVYSTPITVSATETVMAIAIASGYANSTVATAAFTISLPAPAPAITPAGGAFTGAQSVTISDALAGATIYYTLDGSMPSQTSTLYGGAIAVNATETINAVAVAPGYSLSPVSTAIFNLAAATPILSPAGGSFSSVQSVTIADATAGASVYYIITPSGSAPATPTTGSTRYTGAVQVAASETIEAIAVAAGYSQSATSSAAYTINLPPAATPVISSPGGTFSTAQTVTITDATATAAIYYTTNGSLPSATAGTLYTGPIAVNTSETIQAIAVAFGSSNSAIASEAFSLVAATPVISPATGTYTTVQSVTITDATAGALIYYTTNGSTPSAANGTLYGGAISISSNETVQAIAVASGFTSSAVAVAAFTINLPPAATPVLSPAGGTFNATQTVTISEATAGATVYYTVNGSAPNASNGTPYSGPVPVASSETVQAIAVAPGNTNSAIASATFNLVAATPVISPASGTYTTIQSVTITDATTGASIYYTTNGSMPSATNGTLYAGAISVSSNETVQAIAIDTGFANSTVAVTAFTINLAPAATPVISPAGGTFNATQTVTISDATTGAAIYYTTNGTTPSATSGTLYSGSISVTSSETIEAIAVASGSSNSAIASAAFGLVAATPKISPAAGTYTTVQAITITDATAGASIYYTIDGSSPSASNGTLYAGVFSVSSSETVQAIAIAPGFTNSTIAVATFTINLPVTATPVISPNGGTFASQSTPTVTLADATAGSTIYYTLDGSTPSATNGIAYHAAFTVAATETVKAIAVTSGYSNSVVVAATFTINQAATATPTFSPAAGTYTTVQTISLADTTAAASIYYTLDGSTPSAQHGTLYSGPITVSATQTIEAIATAAGFNNSVIASATFTINLVPAATPTFSPAAGTYASAQTVTLGDATAGAAIYYTLDGSTPTAQHGTLYSTAITVFTTETIKAIATASGLNPSAVASATYTLMVAAPTFSPAAGTYISIQTVSLADTTAGAMIYYTLDNSAPSAQHGTLYTGPITVSATETIKAVATESGFNPSTGVAAIYTINLTAAATPAISPGTGTYNSAQTVMLTDSTVGAAIYYTLDGSTPTAASNLYSGVITVSTSETIKAIAVASGFSNSAAASATYTLTAATPTFSPATGTYTSSQTVTLGDTTAAANVYYTLDGSTPSAQHGMLYSTAITVSATETIKAIAIATGFNNSAVASATFTINLKTAATPMISPGTGTYNSSQTVMLTDATIGAAIYYTTDGTTPTASSTLYSGTAITVSAAETIKAIAIASGYANSAVASATYSFTAATPVIAPAGGTFTTSTQTVTITDATSGASIYYTITAGSSGTVPTTASTLYSGPFTISATDTVEAIAIETGYTSSAVASATFTQMVTSGPSVSGTVSSGTLPIIGASVQLYAAGKTGYGSAPATVGSAVITGANGSFSLPYTCPTAPGDLIYVVATGGSISASGGSNAGLGLMTALGPCASLPTTSIAVNEVTTIASVYALSGFASLATGGGINVGAPAPTTTCTAANIGNSSCNYPGLFNAFATVNNLVDVGGGAALTITPAYAANPLPFLNTSTVPQARIDTLADILATCVEASPGCATLFGDVGGTTPIDTIQAAFDIAQNPGTNVATLYSLLQATPPYTPTLASIGDTAAPTDWTLAISYTGAGLGVDYNADFFDNVNGFTLALDGLGNVWVGAGAPNSGAGGSGDTASGMVAGFNNLGAPLTPVTVYDPNAMIVITFGGFGPQNFGSNASNGVYPIDEGPYSLAIDATNNLWVTSSSNTMGQPGNSVAELAAVGNPPVLSLSSLSGTGPGYIESLDGYHFTSLAFDLSGNLWAPEQENNSPINEYNPLTGTLSTQLTSASGQQGLQGITFDSNGGLWVGDQTNSNTLLYNDNSGTLLATYGNTQGSYLAAGAQGNIFTCNSAANGYDFLNSSSLSNPLSTFDVSAGCMPLVVDGAGNIWSVGNTNSGGYLTEVSASGTLLTPAGGYTGTTGSESPTLLTVAASATPQQAVDGSGNMWVLNYNNFILNGSVEGNAVVEYVGLASPTIPNLAVATQNGAQGTRP